MLKTEYFVQDKDRQDKLQGELLHIAKDRETNLWAIFYSSGEENQFFVEAIHN